MCSRFLCSTAEHVLNVSLRCWSNNEHTLGEYVHTMHSFTQFSRRTGLQRETREELLSGRNSPNRNHTHTSEQIHNEHWGHAWTPSEENRAATARRLAAAADPHLQHLHYRSAVAVAAIPFFFTSSSPSPFFLASKNTCTWKCKSLVHVIAPV